MGTVARQEKLGDSSITISFESYEDFLDYQEKEREQQEEVVDQMFAAPQEQQAYWHLQLTREEYYYLSCILGHLVPAGEVSKSLLDKVSTYELDCDDFDKVSLSCTEIKLNEEE